MVKTPELIRGTSSQSIAQGASKNPGSIMKRQKSTSQREEAPVRGIDDPVYEHQEGEYIMISSNATSEEGKYLSISAQWDCHDYNKLSVDAIFQRAKLAFVADVKKA